MILLACNDAEKVSLSLSLHTRLWDGKVPFKHAHFQNVGLNAMARAETKSRGMSVLEALNGSCEHTIERILREVNEAFD